MKRGGSQQGAFDTPSEVFVGNPKNDNSDSEPDEDTGEDARGLPALFPSNREGVMNFPAASS